MICDRPSGSHGNVPIVHLPCCKVDPLIRYGVRWDPVWIKHYISPWMVTLVEALQVEEANPDPEWKGTKVAISRVPGLFVEWCWLKGLLLVSVAVKLDIWQQQLPYQSWWVGTHPVEPWKFRPCHHGYSAHGPFVPALGWLLTEAGWHQLPNHYVYLVSAYCLVSAFC